MPHGSMMDWLLLAAGLVAMPLASLWAGRRLVDARSGGREVLTRYRWIILRGLLLSLTLLGVWAASGRPFARLGLGLAFDRLAWLGFGIDAVLIVVMAWQLFLTRRGPEQKALIKRRLIDSRMAPQTRAEFVLFPQVALIGSIAEELFFRGYMFWILGPMLGVWGAAVATALLFGIAHAYQGLAGIVRTGLIGLAFGIGFALTGSLWWLIIAHALMNLAGYVLALKVREVTPAAAG
ncbi:MAG: CPBP family intramembrane glutamic endopeptidase [Sphingomonadaceae bacterium]